MSKELVPPTIVLSRREFLLISGIGLASAHRLCAAGIDGPRGFRFRVRRPRDLMDLEFTFVNFTLFGDDLIADGSQSLVIVKHAPQNLGEASFTDPDPPADWKVIPAAAAQVEFDRCKPPVSAYLSGPSWVVFRAPAGERMPLVLSCRSPETGQGPCCGAEMKPTIDGSCPVCGRMPRSAVDYWLRKMSDWNLRVPVPALKSGSMTQPTLIAMPAADETCIEVPFRLMLAPTSEDISVTTSADRLPYDSLSAAMMRNRSVLWHAALRSRQKLAPPIDQDPDIPIPPELSPPSRITLHAKAVWSPDMGVKNVATYYPGTDPLSLRAMTRRLLVEQASHEDSWIDAERLILTALGASANLSYTSTVKARELLQQQLTATEIKQENSLAFWRHRITVGRDQFYVEAYYLFAMPLVLPSIYVEVTQRHFASVYRNAGRKEYGPPGAYLLKRSFILMTDPKRQFPSAESALGRMMPFKKVELRDSRSPYILNPTAPGNAVSQGAVVSADQPNFESPPQALRDKNDAGQAITIPDTKTGFYFFPKLLSDGSYFRWSALIEDDTRKQTLSDDVTLLFASNVIKGQQLWQAAQPGLREWKTKAAQMSFAPQQPTLNIRTVLSRKSRHLSSGATLPDPFVFLDSERRAVRAIGDALRQKLATISSATAQVDFLCGQSRNSLAALLTGVGESAITIHALRDQSIQAFLASAKAIKNDASDKTAAMQEMLRQLSGAEQVSTALELHSITLDCHKTYELYQGISNLKAKATSILTGAMPPASVAEYIDALKKELGSLDSSLKQSIINQLESLKRFENLLGSPADKLTAVSQVAEKYFAEIEQFKMNAAGLGVDKFQAGLQEAKAAIPAIKAMAGQTATKTIKLLEGYAAQGINEVGNSAFGEVVGMLNEGKAMADQLKTGLAAPSAMVAGLSRDLGAIVASGKQQLLAMAGLPTESLDLANAVPDAKLFGILPLRELLGALAAGQKPTINMLQTPESIEQVWEWVMPLKPKYSLSVLTVLIDPKKLGNVRLRLKLVTKLTLGKPQAIVDGQRPVTRIELDGFLGKWDEIAKNPKPDRQDETFHVVLADLISAQFYNLGFSASYTSGDEPKPKITPEFKDIEFLGPLKFVKDFQDRLKNLGGFELVVTPVQIGVGLNLPIPPFAFGVVAMRNILLNLKFLMPLQQNPLRFEFSFCTWEQPFELSVMGFAGGGFFSAALQTDGLRDLKGALEFGGSLAFDVAVASGGVHVRAGIYGRMFNATTEIMGYLRAWGELSVIGLINASVTFLLGLVYRNDQGNNELYGICEVTVSIDILFVFSGDVNIRMEKHIVGSQEDSGNKRLQANGLRALTAAPVVDSLRRSFADASTRRAYFDRPAQSGRFDWDAVHPAESIRAWNSLYFSQFAND